MRSQILEVLLQRYADWSVEEVINSDLTLMRYKLSVNNPTGSASIQQLNHVHITSLAAQECRITVTIEVYRPLSFLQEYGAH